MNNEQKKYCECINPTISNDRRMCVNCACPVRPASMNNESKCCDKCWNMMGLAENPPQFLCSNPSCPCHILAKSFEGLPAATLKEIDTPAPTNNDYSYVSHSHCWNQKQPPACGIPLEKHKQCCLCDTPAPEDWEPEITAKDIAGLVDAVDGPVEWIQIRTDELRKLLSSEKAAARREGAESERKAVIEELLKIESEKWEDAEHCSCLGYAIIQMVGGEDTPRGKEVEKRMQDAARSEGVNG